jgi:hypothetical protein
MQVWHTEGRRLVYAWELKTIRLTSTLRLVGPIIKRMPLEALNLVRKLLRGSYLIVQGSGYRMDWTLEALGNSSQVPGRLTKQARVPRKFRVSGYLVC